MQGRGGIQQMAGDGFGAFLDRAAHTVLSHDEVIALARQVVAGQQAEHALEADHLDVAARRGLVDLVEVGRSAKHTLVRHNLRLVLSISSRYKVEGIPAEDLFQEGVLGLIRAIEKFDPERDLRLSTYATWWIRQSVGRAVAEKSRIIRLPVHVHDNLHKVLRAQNRLRATTGRAPLDDLVDATGLQPSTILELLRLAPRQTSLDALVGDGLTTLGDLQPDQHSLGPEAETLRRSTADEVADLLEHLPAREADVLRLRFGIGIRAPLTLETIGVRYGVTRERIRQIELRALKTLRRRVGIRPAPPKAHSRTDDDADDELGVDNTGS